MNPEGSERLPPAATAELSRLRSEVATLRHLLEVHEETALEQASRAEQALEELQRTAAAGVKQAQLVHELVDASPDAVLVLDADWTMQYMNTAAKQAIAADADLTGRKLLDAFPRLVDTRFYERYEIVMRDRTPMAFEDFHTMRQRWYVVNVAPVGQGIAIFFLDITERKKQEAALARTEKLAAVGRMASSISHEINNPLESVVNLLYLIEHMPGASTDMRTYAALASSEMQRVSHIVTQTLKFHRQSTHAQATRMSEILESVVSLFQGRLATLSVSLHRRFAARDEIVCFAGDMRQVFANLFGNALDALAGTGNLWLRIRPAVDWKTGQRGLRVMVADDGCGMSEATQAGLFEAFFTTKPATGTGLGLWVSLEIIRNHRGWVRVRSTERPGRSGTVFALFFPLGEEPRESGAVPAR